MVRLAISVEGQTEESFVNKLLVPQFFEDGIIVTPVLLNGRGGDVSISRITKDLNKLANSFDMVTTLYDFYGFRGKEADDDKASLESKILNSISETLRSKVIPYVQMYEFEGILFSSPEHIEAEIGNKNLEKWANNILQEFNGNPESINNSQQTAPSKRLSSKATYIKTIHGPNIAQAIGLRLIREKCKGFNDWISSLESLSSR